MRWVVAHTSSLSKQLWIGLLESRTPQEATNLVMVPNSRMEDLLRDVTEGLHLKDNAIGDLLQLMEPRVGAAGEVSVSSDRVVSIQTELEQKLSLLSSELRNATASQNSSRDVINHPSMSIKEPLWSGTGGDIDHRTQVEELKRYLAGATQREKDRVEGLQVAVVSRLL